MDAQGHDVQSLVSRLEMLEQRNTQLERQQRRFRAAGVVAVAGLCTAFLVGAGGAAPKTVTAERFVVTGPEGAEMAEFGYYGKDGVGLIMRDKNKMRVVMFGVTPEGQGALELRGKDQLAVKMIVNKEGFAGLDVKDPAGKQRIYLGLPWQSEPQLQLSDKNTQRVWIGGEREGFGLGVKDKDGNWVFQAPKP